MDIKLKDFFYISNILSIIRLFLGIPIFYFLSKTDAVSFYLVPILGATAIITDYFDGYFARKYNQISELGKIIDPIADKICSAFVLLGLVLFRNYPWGVLVLLMYRDVLILIFGTIISKKKGEVVSSIFLGKLNTTLIGLSAFFFCIKLNDVLDLILIIACYVMIIISGFAYLKLGEKMLELNIKQKIIFRTFITLLNVIIVISFFYLNKLFNHFLL
ncbi:MAG TPA: CDP-alcohol phosphatidyltransferase family protein [Melioribacteraceae bacterium]|nr:CDP-alcohol phosphatidyltransferase family protein [Melioribacteraceae bacterium]